MAVQMTDMDHVTSRLRALIGPDQHPDRLIAFSHPGAPSSKARARMMKAGYMFTPKKTMDAQRDLANHFASLRVGEPPMVENVAIVAIFYRPNLQRIDGDNLMKLVMDAATQAAIWRDDCQVTAHAALVEFDPIAPRTLVALCPYISSLVRAPEMFVCPECEKSFERPGWRKKKRKGRPLYCSIPCAQAAKLSLVRCPKCSEVFTRVTAGQRYCSTKCADAEHLQRQPEGYQRPWPNCSGCGVRVSRREYTLCAVCRGMGRPGKPKEKTLF